MRWYVHSTDKDIATQKSKQLSFKYLVSPGLLPGKSHGQRSLVGYSLWGRKESDTTERLHFHFHFQVVNTVFQSRDRLFVAPWIVALQAPLSTGFSRQEYWSGLPFPPPGDLPDPGIQFMSVASAGGFFTTSHLSCHQKGRMFLWLQSHTLPTTSFWMDKITFNIKIQYVPNFH